MDEPAGAAEVPAVGAERRSMTVRGAAFLGVGSMVGAGIFALLGEAGAVGRAGVEQLLGAGDLVGEGRVAIGGDAANVAGELLLGLLLLRRGTLGHAVSAGDETSARPMLVSLCNSGCQHLGRYGAPLAEASPVCNEIAIAPTGTRAFNLPVAPSVPAERPAAGTRSPWSPAGR